MRHLMQERMARRLEKFDGLPRLAPAASAPLWIRYIIEPVEEVLCSVAGEKCGTKTDLGRELIVQGLCVCQGEGIATFVGRFAGDDKFKLEGVTRITAGPGLDTAKHGVDLVLVFLLKVVGEPVSSCIVSKHVL